MDYINCLKTYLFQQTSHYLNLIYRKSIVQGFKYKILLITTNQKKGLWVKFKKISHDTRPAIVCVYTHKLYIRCLERILKHCKGGQDRCIFRVNKGLS